MSSSKKKVGGKLHGKAAEQRRSAAKAAEIKEILDLSKRIAQETPPHGTNPLSNDSPADSFVPGSAGAADASAAASSTPAAAASSGGPAAQSNKAAKQAARAASSTVLYGAVRKFSELPISQRTIKALTDASFTRLTDIQRAAIPHALAGRDILGAARTGSGKTLAYLVPVLERLYRERWSKQDGVGALIIVPTRELAMQIFDVLRSSVGKTHAYSAGLVIGGKDLSEEQDRISSMNILICTPGRILQHLEQTYGFKMDNLQILVLDEADRILDLGFSQTMNDIISYLPSGRQTLLFSATQTKNIKELAKLSLRDPEYIAVHESAQTALPNKLVQHYTLISADQKINLLYSYIKTHLQVKSIIFLSSGKQKMKQQKRMAIYYDFCNKNHCVLFCTDLAARGLDFPDVDWVVQMDAPENVATYIHRVGRTARYRSGGKSLLFLLPSELTFITALQSSAKISATASGPSPLIKVKADPSKMKDVTPQFSAFLAENTELKFLAQKAFVSYVRSIALQSDKSVFDASALPFDALARSMGLLGAPKVKLPKSGGATASTTSAAHKEKNMPHQLRELLAEKNDPRSKAERKAARAAAPLTAVDKILSRQNATVFSKSREQLRAKPDSDAEDEEEDDTFRVRRRNHELSSDDEGDEAMLLSSESDESDDEGDEEGGEGEDGAAASKSSSSKALRAELEKRSKGKGEQITPKSIEDTTDDFLAVAAARVAQQDPADRAAEHARVKAKHLARKIAKKRALRASEREDDESDGDDGVVVTLGRPDGEDDDEDMQQQQSSADDDDDDEEAAPGDDSASEAEPEEASAASKKRKAAAATASSAAAPASKQAPASKKQKVAPAKPKTLAEQEALALKILGM